jgi:hypothetical protein
MAIVFGMCIGAMVLAWLSAPLKEPVEFHARSELDLTSSKGALIAGMISILITLTLYVIFSPLVVAR